MRILITRFSALGDVALLVPVIKKFTEAYPQHEVMVVSRGFLKPLFEPLSILFFEADIFGKHKGISGLWKLHREVKASFKPDVVLDMHAVLRTYALGNFFKLSGVSVHRIDKGRPEKKALTAKTGKQLKPLPHTTVRYASVFEKAGFKFNFDPKETPNIVYRSAEADTFIKTELENPPKTIGIAPFAYHKGKTWPADKMKAAIEALAEDGFDILLFGGPGDADALSVWSYELPNTINLAGRFGLATELAIMSSLRFFVAMDSSNMHFAALVGIPVISIWGATHPFAGFGPLGEKQADGYFQLTHEALGCRPCSVFGNKPCWRGDYACLNGLSTEAFIKKTKQF